MCVVIRVVLCMLESHTHERERERERKCGLLIKKKACERDDWREIGKFVKIIFGKAELCSFNGKLSLELDAVFNFSFINIMKN